MEELERLRILIQKHKEISENTEQDLRDLHHRVDDALKYSIELNNKLHILRSYQEPKANSLWDEVFFITEILTEQIRNSYFLIPDL